MLCIHDELDHEEHDGNRNAHISDIEDMDDVYIDKVGYFSGVEDSVDEVTDCSGADKDECDSVESFSGFQFGVRNRRDYRNDERNRREPNTEILEKAESDAGVVDECELEYAGDDVDLLRFDERGPGDPLRELIDHQDQSHPRHIFEESHLPSTLRQRAHSGISSISSTSGLRIRDRSHLRYSDSEKVKLCSPSASSIQLMRSIVGSSAPNELNVATDSASTKAFTKIS